MVNGTELFTIIHSGEWGAVNLVSLIGGFFFPGYRNDCESRYLNSNSLFFTLERYTFRVMVK